MSDRPTPEREILNTQEGAFLLRMSEGKLRELANQGQVPAYRVGRRLRFRRVDLLEWVEAQALSNVDRGDEHIRLERLFTEKHGHAPSTDLVAWAKFLTANKDGKVE